MRFKSRSLPRPALEAEDELGPIHQGVGMAPAPAEGLQIRALVPLIGRCRGALSTRTSSVRLRVPAIAFTLVAVVDSRTWRRVPPAGSRVPTGSKKVESLGGKITPDPLPDNPYHALLSGLTPEQAWLLFRDTIPNPAR
jgi:hypothetical protein